MGLFKEIALKIAEKEKGKEEVNIAQINEILHHTLDILSELPDQDLHSLLYIKDKNREKI